MKDRRQFLNSAIGLGAASALGVPAARYIDIHQKHHSTTAADDRAYLLSVMEKIARPVLKNLAQKTLRKTMPVEAANPADRAQYTHLEALGRLLAGIAPWLAAHPLDESEGELQAEFIQLAQASLDSATDPTSPDFMNFHSGGQPLVDSAFLAQAILRAPDVLCRSLDPRVQRRVIDALKSSRVIETPPTSNWVMFSATIEAALHLMRKKTIDERLAVNVRRMLGWYKGDGLYGDGEFFHFDYYNSFVIHPMLLDCLAVMRQMDQQFEPFYQTELRRARRYAEIQERLIAPDATFPCIGRSVAYRFGALHALAQISLLRELPDGVTPAQVRCAMTAVIRKMIEAPGPLIRTGG